MSQEKTPRIYSHTLAAMTLCLRPEPRRNSWNQLFKKSNISVRQWIRLCAIALLGIILGLVLGWLQSH